MAQAFQPYPLLTMKMKFMTAGVRHSHLQLAPYGIGGRSLLLVPAAAIAQMGGVDGLVTAASL